MKKLRIGFILLAGIALVVGLGSWIGVLLSRRVIAPVAHLADRVKHLEPENLPDRLSQSFTDDEVGVLAKYMEQAVARIGSFVRRERQFTRDASHELRTPVTVIKGAVVLIETQLGADTKSILRPLARIKRAVADMENLIETFLWLGRKESLEPYSGRCEVVPIVEQVINQTRHMFADKPVEVELHTAADPVLAAPPTAFQAVVANLIKNAFQFTSRGKIAVSVCDDHLAVTDSGHGIAACDLQGLTQPYVRGEKSVGFGLGLAIVKRLCRRFGWRFTLSGDTAQGTVAYLYFRNEPAAPDQTGLDSPPPDR